jgi:hypothetical protein
VCDNKNRPADKNMQFCLALLWFVLDLDLLVMGCNAGGYSKYNFVEKVNGALQRRFGGIELRVPAGHTMQGDDQQKRNLSGLLDKLIARGDKATYNSSGDGFVHCLRGKSTPVEGFAFNANDIAGFLACNVRSLFYVTLPVY